MSMLKRGAWWPIGITALLGTTVVANLWVMRIARADPSMVVEADYYRKGIRWDDEMAQARRNAALGWTLTSDLAPAGASQRADVTVDVRDATGAPLHGARVTLEAFAVARSAALHSETLVPYSGGYRGTVPVTTVGRWELRFTVVRGGDRFTAVRRVDATRRSGAPT